MQKGYLVAENMHFVIVINGWIWTIIVPLYCCAFDNTARILDNKPKVSSCSVVTTAKDSPKGEIKMAEDRLSNKPKRRSSLYTSTIDDLVVEDKTVNAVSTAEDLKVSICVHFPFLFLSHQFALLWSTLIVLAEESGRAWLVHLGKPERSQNSNPAHLWWLCNPGGDLGYVYFKASITGS